MLTVTATNQTFKEGLSHRTRRPVPVADLTSTIWYKATFALGILTSLDVIHLFVSPYLRYLPIFIVLCLTLSAILVSKKHNRFSHPNVAKVVMIFAILFAFPGGLYNKFLTSHSSNLMIGTLLFILPLSAEFYPLQGRTITPTKIIRTLFLVSGAYFIASSVALFGAHYYGLPNFHVYAHERAYMMPLLFLPFIIQRRWIPSVFFAAISLVLFYYDPRSTMGIVLATSIVLVWILPRFTSKTCLFILILGLCAAVFFGISSFASVANLDSQFKTAVGGRSNADMRENYHKLAMSDFRKSPLFGDFFSGEVGYSYVFGRYGGGSEELQRPIHNDFLVLLARGGVIGGGIFFTAIITSLVIALRNYRICIKHGFKEMGRLLLILAVTLISGLICMTVNPIVNSVSTGWAFYYLLALVMLTDRYIHVMRESRRTQADISCPALRRSSNGYGYGAS